MANPVFFVRGELGQSLSQFRDIKHRIVPEALRSYGCFSDEPFQYSFDDFHLFGGGSCHGCHCDEAGSALLPRNTLQLTEQFAPVIHITRGLTRISRGVHARSAPERVDLQASIVRDGREARMSRYCPRLLDRVGFAGLPVLCYIRNFWKVGQCPEPDSQIAEQSSQLGALVAIPRCQHQLFDQLQCSFISLDSLHKLAPTGARQPVTGGKAK